MKKSPHIIIYICFLIFSFINHAKSEIAFSFDNVNLISVMNVLSTEVKNNIIIDEDIDEKISLIINHPLSKEKIISTLQNALLLKNIVLIQNENGDLIIKKDINIKVNAPISKKGLNGFQIFIINLENVSPDSMAPFLSQYFSDKNSIIPSPSGKSITFIGNKNDYKRLITLIEKFDVKAEKKSSEIKIKYSDSSEITSVLQSLISEGNWLVNPINEVSVINLEKLNSIYVSAPKNSFNQIKEFVKDLDKVKIENNIDKKINNKVSNNNELQKETKGNKKHKKTNKFGFDVISLKHSSSTEIETTLNNLISNSPLNINDNSTSSDEISIQSYMPGNQIILSGKEINRKKIIELINNLDVPVKQVFVEAIVAELSNSKAKELGLQFSGASGKTGLTLLNKNSLGANISSNINSFISDGISLTLGPGASQLSNIGALINVIENDGNSEILATPTLLAMNNKEAQILVGSNIPIITGKFTSNSSESASSPFQTISRQDVGIIFKIRPVIGSDGFITINMKQEVSELDTSSALASDIVTTKRAIETSAVLKSGRTLAIGGLINETTQFLGAKIPVLGDIPGLKELFNQRRVTKSKRNLVIFLKPTIIDSNNVNTITIEKYMKLKNDLEQTRSSNYFNLKYPPLPLIEGLQ